MYNKLLEQLANIERASELDFSGYDINNETHVHGVSLFIILHLSEKLPLLVPTTKEFCDLATRLPHNHDAFLACLQHCEDFNHSLTLLGDDTDMLQVFDEDKYYVTKMQLLNRKVDLMFEEKSKTFPGFFNTPPIKSSTDEGLRSKIIFGS